jgi:hypothetical protein
MLLILNSTITKPVIVDTACLDNTCKIVDTIIKPVIVDTACLDNLLSRD